MSFYMCNLVEIVSLPYSYFLCSDTSTSLSSKEVFEVLMKLLAGTEEGNVCTVEYTVCQNCLCACMCSCFYMIGVGYKPMCGLFEHSFEDDCFPSIIQYVQICHRPKGTYVQELLYGNVS